LRRTGCEKAATGFSATISFSFEKSITFSAFDSFHQKPS
jgi:hypothetical protein